jgi:Arc/MetJ-type ribon-helix-helix transcriptional regulator
VRARPGTLVTESRYFSRTIAKATAAGRAGHSPRSAPYSPGGAPSDEDPTGCGKTTGLALAEMAGICAPRQVRQSLQEYDPDMSDNKAQLTVTVDASLNEYAEQQVADGRAPSVSAVINSALAEMVRRDREAVNHLREVAAQADPAKVARMKAHVEEQLARIRE